MTAKIAFAFPTHPMPGTALGMTPPEIHFSHNVFSSDQDNVSISGDYRH
jgi:hypothetical protein